MTPDEIRVKVAEAMGWKLITYYKNSWEWKSPFGEGGYWSLSELPEYPTSRDACAEFEAGLTTDECFAYGETLAAMVRLPENIAFGDKPEKKFPFNGFGFFNLATLTPLQRCEAFLRVKGVWK